MIYVFTSTPNSVLRTLSNIYDETVLTKIKLFFFKKNSIGCFLEAPVLRFAEAIFFQKNLSKIYDWFLTTPLILLPSVLTLNKLMNVLSCFATDFEYRLIPWMKLVKAVRLCELFYKKT